MSSYPGILHRQGSSLSQLEAEVVEVGFRRRMGTEFVDDRPETGQGADRGQSRRIGWPNQAA